MPLKRLKKRLAKLKQNPEHVRFNELDALLRDSPCAGYMARTIIIGRKFCAPQDVKDLVRYLEHEGSSHEEEQ